MKLSRLIPTAIAGLFSLGVVKAEEFHTWAERPVMGWNSWDFYGTTVTEAQIKAQADFMAANLLDHGWDLITVDIQWYAPDPVAAAASNGSNSYHQYHTPNAELLMDANGRLVPGSLRFPSSAGGQGFKPLADYVHGLGLKFGIHLMRGIPRQAVLDDLPILGTSFTARDIADTSSTCPWNPDMYGVDMSRPGAQEYYDSLFEMYASWEVDLVKVDDLSRPYHLAEIEGIRRAIDKTGREIVLSTSPGETPLTAGPHVMNHANQWRISDDFWDNWGALFDQFQRLHDWTPYRGPGHFPDADMLPLGKIDANAGDTDGRSSNFSADEAYTLMSLWAIARSPLIHGGDMTQMDGFTRSLLTNDEVIAVNQRSTRNRQLFRNGELVAWVADDEVSADKYLALFNTGGSSTTVPVDLADLGFTGSTQVRSLWTGTDLGSFEGSFSPEIASHGAGLYRLSGALIPTPWLVSTDPGAGVVRLKWDAVGLADSFSVKRGPTEDGPFTLVADSVSGTTFEDTTVENGNTYYYVVSATVSGEEGPNSNALLAIPTLGPGAVSWNLDAYGTIGGDGEGATPRVSNVAGVVPTGFWNNSYPADPTSNLIDATGNLSGIGISYSSSAGNYFIRNSHPGLDADGSSNKEMLNGYLNAGGGATSSVEINGVPDGLTYDLYVYFSSDVAGRTGTVTDGSTTYDFSTIGAPSIESENAVLTRTQSTDGTTFPAANYAVFTCLSGSAQVIEVDIPAYGGIAGFQLVPDPLPQVSLRIEAQPGGSTAVLSWPPGLGAVILEQSGALGGWEPADPQPESNSITVPIDSAHRFYRLRRGP